LVLVPLLPEGFPQDRPHGTSFCGPLLSKTWRSGLPLFTPIPTWPSFVDFPPIWMRHRTRIPQRRFRTPKRNKPPMRVLFPSLVFLGSTLPPFPVPFCVLSSHIWSPGTARLSSSESLRALPLFVFSLFFFFYMIHRAVIGRPPRCLF